MHKKEVKNFVRCPPKSRLPGRFFRRLAILERTAALK